MNIKEIEKAAVTEDDIILLGEPKVIEKYGEKIRIEQVNWMKEWDKLCYWVGVFLQYLYLITDSIKLTNLKEDVVQFRDMVRATVGNNRVARFAMMKCCKFVRMDRRRKMRWLKKHFSIDDWVEIFAWLYIYNVAGVKKNCAAALLRLGVHQSN